MYKGVYVIFYDPDIDLYWIESSKKAQFTINNYDYYICYKGNIEEILMKFRQIF